jgi:hypothetical protein
VGAIPALILERDHGNPEPAGYLVLRGRARPFSRNGHIDPLAFARTSDHDQ